MKKYKLIAPLEYKKMTKGELALICNGCGTSGWKGALVPETIYLLRVTEACQIHDFMYFMGLTLEDKAEADEVFLQNMNIIINHCPWYLIPKLNSFREVRANTYYLAVKHFGKKAFLEGKYGINYNAFPEKPKPFIKIKEPYQD